MDAALPRGTGLRRAFWRQLDPEACEHEGLSLTNKVIVFTVILPSIAAVVETEPAVEGMAPRGFAGLRLIFAVLFLTAYLRIWASSPCQLVSLPPLSTMLFSEAERITGMTSSRRHSP